MKIIIIPLVFIIVIFISCIEEIKLNDNYTAPKLVVNSFISTEWGLVVNLYQNKPINSKFEPSLKTKANVVLYENGIEKEILKAIPYPTDYYNNQTNEYISDSTYKYYSKETIIKTGNTYKIVVECEGFETVTAETTVPFPVPVTSFDSLTIVKNSNGSQKLEYNYKLRFTDPANETNYYRLVVKDSYAQKNTLILGTDTIEYINSNYYPRSVYIDSSDPLLSNENKDANSYLFGELDNSYGIFSDEMINGKPYELNFVINYQGSWGYSNLSVNDIDYEAGEYRMVKLIIQTLSPDMYYYLKSIDAQEHSDYQMFTEPVPIYSNVKNGFGVFASYSSSSANIIYGEYPKEGIKYYTWQEVNKMREEYNNN